MPLSNGVNQEIKWGGHSLTARSEEFILLVGMRVT